MRSVREMVSKVALYKQIQTDIKQKIASGVYRPKDRIPSEQELMDAYKVSKITVKNALAELADAGIVVRIQGKGTFVADDASAADAAVQDGQSAGKRPLVGFIIPTMKTGVIRKMVDHMERYLKEAGYQMILGITRESAAEESRTIHDMLGAGVRGLVVFPTEDEKYNESLLRLSLDKFPFVFIDRYLRNIETNTITSDNLGGAKAAVSHLLSKGHRDIALLSPENANTTVEDRTAGFEQAYIEHGISIDKSLWCHVPLNILRSEEAPGYVTSFLEARPSVSAVFTLTEEIANLTAGALARLGRSGVELVSFDDPGLPNVPYIAQDEEEIVRAAVALLDVQIKREYDPRQIVVPVELVMP